MAFDDESLDNWSSRQNPRFVIDRVINFVLEHPEFGPAWLYRSVIQGDYEQDPFWKKFSEHMELFSESEFSEPDIDIEIYSFMMLSSLFLWPHWVRSNSRSAKKRSSLVGRFKKEILRLSKNGVVRVEMDDIDGQVMMRNPPKQAAGKI